MNVLVEFKNKVSWRHPYLSLNLNISHFCHIASSSSMSKNGCHDIYLGPIVFLFRKKPEKLSCSRSYLIIRGLNFFFHIYTFSRAKMKENNCLKITGKANKT